MKKKFSFNRFKKYFRYDLSEQWQQNARIFLLLGATEAMAYLMGIILGLLFNGGSPYLPESIETRIGLLIIASLFFAYLNNRRYNYLRQKNSGTAWVLIPASGREKMLSLLIISLIIFPLGFLAEYLLLDGVITSLDPRMGQSLVAGTYHGLTDIFHMPVSELRYLGPTLLVTFFLACWGIQYMLLCGLLFKRHRFLGILLFFFAIPLLFHPLYYMLQYQADLYQSILDVNYTQMLWISAAYVFLLNVLTSICIYCKITKLQY